MDGLTGWGEAAPNPRHGESVESARAALEALKAVSFAMEPLYYRSFLDSYRSVVSESPAAEAALTSAVLDWSGKRLGLPVHRMLGVDPGAMKPTSFTIGIDEPGVMAERARTARDFEVLKIKLGTGQDRALIRAVRDASSVRLRVDANEGWSDPESALKEIEWMAAEGVEFVEQPLPAAMIAELEWLKERSPLPLIADESVKSVADLWSLRRGFHGVNIKLAKCGGSLAALDLIGAARALGMRVMLGCMVESSCGLAAAAQIGPLADFLDLDSHLMVENDPFEGMEISGGVIRLSSRPGIGVRLSGMPCRSSQSD